MSPRGIGGLIGLINRNGVRGYFECFGMQDIEVGKPMAGDSIFRLMSMTKPLIALTALVLYDEGKFGLDDPSRRICPSGLSQRWRNGQLIPAGGPLPRECS